MMKTTLTLLALSATLVLPTRAQSVYVPSTNITPAAAKAGWNYDAAYLTNILRFQVYYGPTPGYYTNVVATSTNTLSVTISNLVRGETYFFMCTAVDKNLIESEPSNVVEWMPPGRPPRPQLKQFKWNGVYAMVIEAEPYSQFALQDSSDLKRWHTSRQATTDDQGTVTLALYDPRQDGVSSAARFYRVPGGNGAPDAPPPLPK